MVLFVMHFVFIYGFVMKSLFCTYVGDILTFQVSSNHEQQQDNANI